MYKPAWAYSSLYKLQSDYKQSKLPKCPVYYIYPFSFIHPCIHFSFVYSSQFTRRKIIVNRNLSENAIVSLSIWLTDYPVLLFPNLIESITSHLKLDKQTGCRAVRTEWPLLFITICILFTFCCICKTHWLVMSSFPETNKKPTKLSK